MAYVNFWNFEITTIYTLYDLSILLETRCSQTDRPTNRPTDIATYRAAIAAKKKVGDDGKVSPFRRNIISTYRQVNRQVY